MIFRPFLLTAMAASSTLCPAQRVDFGFQAGITYPSGYITDKVGHDPSLSYGAQLRIKVRDRIAIVPRIDYVEFSGEDLSRGPVPVRVKTNALSLGADCYYYFSGQVGQGFYLGGGAGIIRRDENYTAPDGYFFYKGSILKNGTTTGSGTDWNLSDWLDSPRDDPSYTSTRFFGAVGLGYAFNKQLSVFGRYQFSDPGDSDGKYTTYKKYQLTTIGVEFHF